MSSDEERQHALAAFKGKLIESREWEAKLKNLRLEIKGLQRDFDQTEENIKALQSVGQIIGEVLKQLDDERCEFHLGKLTHKKHINASQPTIHTNRHSVLQSSSKRPPALDMWSAADQRSTRRR